MTSTRPWPALGLPGPEVSERLSCESAVVRNPRRAARPQPTATFSARRRSVRALRPSDFAASTIGGLHVGLHHPGLLRIRGGVDERRRAHVVTVSAGTKSRAPLQSVHTARALRSARLAAHGDGCRVTSEAATMVNGGSSSAGTQPSRPTRSFMARSRAR